MVVLFICLQSVRGGKHHSAPDATFFLSREMMGCIIIKPKHPIKNISQVRFSPCYFYENLPLKMNLFLSGGSRVMVCRCLQQAGALVPAAIRAGCCLQMRENGRVRAASLGDQVLPVLGSGGVCLMDSWFLNTAGKRATAQT